MITVQVRPTARHEVTVSTPPAAPKKVVVPRIPVTTSIQNLLGVDLSALPNPYPGDLDFNADERFTLVYNPDTGQWVAAAEPVITAIDGGTY